MMRRNRLVMWPSADQISILEHFSHDYGTKRGTAQNPDNARTGVIRACRYEPRDKGKVEAGVLMVERWIVAALRHRNFFSLAELNQAIRELLEKLNQRPFRKRPGSRATLFSELDRPALMPLPSERFQLHHWAQ